MSKAASIQCALLAVAICAGCSPATQVSLPQPEAKSQIWSEDTIGPSETSFPNPGPFKLRAVRAADGTTEELWEARGEPGEFGGTISVSTFGSGPKTFNYWTGGDVESGGMGYLMWEKLLETDAWTGKPYPRLARSVEALPNKLDYIIRLRKGLKWSDGKPITADDVVYTIETIVAKRHGQHASSLRDVLSLDGKFPSVEKLDDLTVKFHTAMPFAPFLTELANVPIAPKHAVEPFIRKSREAFQGLWSVNCDPKEIVVSGRFKLDRYVAGQRAEFVRNPNFAMADKLGRRLPYLDKFIYAIVPDMNTMILKFYGGELDLLDIRSIRGADAALMKQRESSGNFTMYNLGPDDGTAFFMVNMCRRKDPKNGTDYVDPIKQKWFNNLHFRQAISHAVDRRRMVDNILRGVGLPLYTPESTASVYFNKSLKPYQQDLKLAGDLLAAGGFVKRGDRLYDREGHPVEFNLITNAGNSNREASAIMIVNDLQKLGIKVNFQPIDWNALINKVETSLDWDSIVMGLSGGKIEPYDGANVWKSDGRLHMFDQRLADDSGKVVVTDARDWEKRIDQLFNLGATTIDETKRRAYFDEYQKIVYEQVPYIYLFSILDLTAVRNTIGNYKPTPLGIFYTPQGSMHNIEEIYIKRKKQ